MIFCLLRCGLGLIIVKKQKKTIHNFVPLTAAADWVAQESKSHAAAHFHLLMRPQIVSVRKTSFGVLMCGELRAQLMLEHKKNK